VKEVRIDISMGGREGLCRQWERSGGLVLTCCSAALWKQLCSCSGQLATLWILCWQLQSLGSNSLIFPHQTCIFLMDGKAEIDCGSL